MTLVPFRDMGAGLNLDGFPSELPDQQWSAARNMRFRDGYAEKSQGDARVHGDLLFDPYGLFPTQGVDGRYWVYAGLTKLAAVKNNTHTDITRTLGAYTGAVTDRWNGGVLSGVLVVNNGKDLPQFWGGNPATKAADLTAWPTGLRSRIVRPFRNHIFMMNNTQDGTRLPYSVRWSHPAEPGTLPTSYDLADATKDAGQVDLADTPDEVVDGVPLGEQFIVYKENSIWAFDYVGAPYVWSNKPISKEAGAIGQDCAVNYPGGHAILTQGDIVRFDGATVASIADARVRRWLFNNLNADRYKRAFAVSNFRRNEVWFCFPQTGSDWCDLALIWNWKDDTWGVRDLPQIATGAAGTIVYEVGNSWDNDPEPWDTDDTTWNQYEYTQATPRLVLASAVNRKLLLTDTGKTFEGDRMRVLLERRGLAYGDPATMKFCRGVRPRIEAPVGTQIDISVGAQSDLDGPVEWAPTIPFVVGRDLKADCMVSGRYLAIRFETSGIVSWRVKQFDMDLQAMGGY